MATVKALVSKYQARLLDGPQYAIATLATAIHDDTPRDTGDAQNSWVLTVNGRTASGVGGNFLSTAQAFKPGNRADMLSSIPYMRRLEYGWSQQSPAGMIRVNVARWPSIVAQGFRQAGAG